MGFEFPVPKKMSKFVDRLNIPVVTTFNGFDLIASDSDHFVGRIGTLGSRAGNFALQNADLVIFLGTRNNIRQVSYNWTSFARHAKKIIIDIDAAELHKKTVPAKLLIQTDAKIFLKKMLKKIPADLKFSSTWLNWCLVRKQKYPVVIDAYKIANEHSVHPYYFIEVLTAALRANAIVVAGNGTACVALFQAGTVKAGQRIFWNSGCAAMGYALPASIGAAMACNTDVVCITGDGSLQLNLQELQTIKQYNLPVKVFILNNHGYSSIEQTQNAFFRGDFIGCNEASGVSFPDNSKLAGLYGFKFYRIDSTSEMAGIIDQILTDSGAVMCEVILKKGYSFAPKLTSVKKPDGSMISSPLEDLYPFLARDEFNSNMIVKDIASKNA